MFRRCDGAMPCRHCNSLSSAVTNIASCAIAVATMKRSAGIAMKTLKLSGKNGNFAGERQFDGALAR